jgi:hypothetical protein
MVIGNHNKKGWCFAKGVHAEHDIDSILQYYGKVFTFGLWFHTNSNGEIIEGPGIKEAIPDGFFILPGYQIAIDLGSAAVTTAQQWHM